MEGRGGGCRIEVGGWRVQVAGCRAQGGGYWVQGARCRVEGAGSRVQGAGVVSSRTNDGFQCSVPALCMVQISYALL